MASVPLAVATADWIVLFAVIFFAWLGALRGFVTIAIHAAGLYGGSFLGARLGPSVGTWITRTFSSVPADQGDLWGWVVVMIACWIVVAVVAAKVRRGLVRARLRGADRFLGALVGAAFAVGISAVAFALWASTKSRPEVKAAFTGSVTVQSLGRFMSESKALLPESVRAKFGPVLDGLQTGK